MKLKSNHRVLSAIQHELELEVAWDEVEKRVGAVIKEFKSGASFDGFRKGKAPDMVVRARVGEKRILDRAAEMTAGDAFNEATRNIEKKPVTPPEFDLGEVKQGEPLRFKAKYYVEPPDPETLAKEIAAKHYPAILSPDQVFPSGPPGIQSHGPYEVSPQILKKIPGVNLADSIIPNPLPSVPNPQIVRPDPGSILKELPDPEKLAKPPDFKPKLPSVSEQPVEDPQKTLPEVEQPAPSPVDETPLSDEKDE